MTRRDAVSWLHFGDLHLTDTESDHHDDLLALIECANMHAAGRVDFAYLPGDTADNAAMGEFSRARAALDRLRIPAHIITGDHDFHTRSLEAFHRVLGARPLPYSAAIGDHRCLFLDMVSAGTGGPDFRLDAAQMAWIGKEMRAADAAGQRLALFMHTYPADLRNGGAALRALMAEHRVACVDMGHTHYNELANDGRTIFMATRSTGQIEEGEAGFSVAAIDGGVVSWRFQPLSGSWPLVLITQPADHRLITDAGSDAQVLGDRVVVAARVLGRSPTERVRASLGGAHASLSRDPDDHARWSGELATDHAPDGSHALTVEARDNAGHRGEETITVRVSRVPWRAPARRAEGSDADALGAWPEKHLLGTQLGPNRNGRKW